jgi:hypothetical protein
MTTECNTEQSLISRWGYVPKTVQSRSKVTWNGEFFSPYNHYINKN